MESEFCLIGNGKMFSETAGLSTAVISFGSTSRSLSREFPPSNVDFKFHSNLHFISYYEETSVIPESFRGVVLAPKFIREFSYMQVNIKVFHE
jgi:hypothetical protein